MASKASFFRGDTLKFQINLFNKDPSSGIEYVYIIPTGADIDVHLPGETATVVLSTLTPGEVTILDASKGQVSCVCSSTKSLLLKLGDNQAIDAIITETSGDITTAEKLKTVKVLDRANP